MKTISTHEAKTHLSRYLAAVQNDGEEFIITRGKLPVARLLPLRPSHRAPRPRVGMMISEPGPVPDEAVRSLSPDQLGEWGL